MPAKVSSNIPREIFVNAETASSAGNGVVNILVADREGSPAGKSDPVILLS